MARLLNVWFWRDVGEGLRANPARSSLTFLAVTIGIFALTTMLAALAGLQEKARRQISEIGADTMILLPPAGGTLDQTAIASLRALAPGSPVAGLRIRAVDGIVPSGPVTAMAADLDFPVIRNWRLTAGRWLDPGDIATTFPGTVISQRLADQLSLGTGDVLVVPGARLSIVGVIDAASPPAVSDGDDRFFMTLPNTPGPWLQQAGDHLRYDAIHLKNRTHDEPGALAQRIRRDGPAQGWPPGWSLITPDQLVAGTRAMMRTVAMVYGSVAALCLLMGGVTLSGLMLIAVQQRTPETGLRMALGASWRDIFFLFLAEALVLSFASGLVGSALATSLIPWLRSLLDIPMALPPFVVALPLVIALLVGLLSAWYPAQTAASVQPADALREK